MTSCPPVPRCVERKAQLNELDSFTFTSQSPSDTRTLGRALGQVAEPGLVVALVGQLGAGKTAFTRAVAEGLGVPDPRVVTSPTFVLIQEYAGRLPIFHFDTYRLRTQEEFVELGVEEYFADEGICLVEWADRVTPILPDDRIELHFEIGQQASRMIECRCVGERFQTMFHAWRRQIAAAGNA